MTMTPTEKWMAYWKLSKCRNAQVIVIQFFRFLLSKMTMASTEKVASAEK